MPDNVIAVKHTSVTNSPSAEECVIGVLAGMGPRSTAPFLELLLDECQAQYGARYDLDYPEIVIISQPTPFYLDRPIPEREMMEAIVKGLRKLQRAGVSFIALPCNSAHVYFDFLQEQIDIPLLNIIDCALSNLPAAEMAAVLATSTTIKSGLYQQALLSKGYRLPSNSQSEIWQTKIESIILDLKELRPEAAKDKWMALLAELCANGIELLISACTELSPLSAFLPPNLRFVDSASALARETIKKYLELKRVAP